tara:strand:+ start:2905 stop:4557 length:1653 start_codon:yes stop_codon:yes gene_type:complete
MSITVSSLAKELIGTDLINMGFPQQGMYFKGYSYIGKKDKVTINVESEISIEFLDALDQIALKHNEKGVVTQARQLKSLILDPDTVTVKTLKGFASGLASYILRGIKNGWLYKLASNDYYIAYMVDDIVFKRAVDRDDVSITTVSLMCHSAKDGSTKRTKLGFYTEDVRGKTIPQILKEKASLFKERDELRAAYDESILLYSDYQSRYGEQFRCIDDFEAQVEGNRFGSEKLSISKGGRLVNNEEGIGKQRHFGQTTINRFWEKKGIEGDDVNEIPFHPYIFFFDLQEHENVWIYSKAIAPYKYDPTLKDKIVLPDDHRDLIDILVSDMDVIVEDFVEGKSGGSIILCMGPPGLGKTLTAEIYSEIVGKPLYRVHSGQLGTNPETVEKRLAEILLRAERWGALLLIDEADIYIRERGDDMDHNAIVASFLRRLEYFSGMLFMTTNRSNDVDDAIISRCAAVLKYDYPDAKQRDALWRSLSNQQGITLLETVIADLVNEYVVICGRDIKSLLLLAAKYQRVKERPLDLETFRHCAIFRGVKHIQKSREKSH